MNWNEFFERRNTGFGFSNYEQQRRFYQQYINAEFTRGTAGTSSHNSFHWMPDADGPQFFFEKEEEPEHGYHDDVRNLTYLRGGRGDAYWVDDEKLARGGCWRCLIGDPHQRCESWKFPERKEWTPSLIYSYDLVILDNVLDLGVDDGAYVITCLDKVYSTDIALRYD